MYSYEYSSTRTVPNPVVGLLLRERDCPYSSVGLRVHVRWKRRIMGHISVALVSAIGDRIAGAPISYALRTSRDSENFHAGAAAQILFMEPDTAGEFHIAPAPCAREAHMGFMNPVVGLLTT